MGGEPKPAGNIGTIHSLDAERAHASLQQRSARGVAVRDDDREAVEEEIGGALGWRGGGLAHRPGHLCHTNLAGHPADEQGASERIQVDVARKLRRQRPELCGGREQQRRSVAAVSQRKRAPRTDDINLSALEPSSGPSSATATSSSAASGAPDLCFACAAANARWARRRGPESARPTARGRRPQRPGRRAPVHGRPTARARRQHPRQGRPLHARGATRDDRDRSQDRWRCQRPMRLPPLVGRSGVVDRRTKQRMTERDPRRQRSGRPPPQAQPPRSEHQARQRRARAASDRRSAQQHRRASGAASPPAAGQPCAGSSPPHGFEAITNPPPQNHRRGWRTTRRAATGAAPADCRGPRR